MRTFLLACIVFCCFAFVTTDAEAHRFRRRVVVAPRRAVVVAPVVRHRHFFRRRAVVVAPVQPVLVSPYVAVPVYSQQVIVGGNSCSAFFSY